MKVFYRFGIRGNNGWRHLIDNSLHCPDIWITSLKLYISLCGFHSKISVSYFHKNFTRSPFEDRNYYAYSDFIVAHLFEIFVLHIIAW